MQSLSLCTKFAATSDGRHGCFVCFTWCFCSCFAPIQSETVAAQTNVSLLITSNVMIITIGNIYFFKVIFSLFLLQAQVIQEAALWECDGSVLLLRRANPIPDVCQRQSGHPGPVQGAADQERNIQVSEWVREREGRKNILTVLVPNSCFWLISVMLYPYSEEIQPCFVFIKKSWCQKGAFFFKNVLIFLFFF